MSFSTLSPIPMNADVRAACDNCEWTGLADDCNAVKDPSQRINAGSEVPAGECPECGCLAYVVKPPSKPTNFDIPESLTVVWDALHEYRDECIPEGGTVGGHCDEVRETAKENDELWDNITTAMAWLTESLGYYVDSEGDHVQKPGVDSEVVNGRDVIAALNGTLPNGGNS